MLKRLIENWLTSLSERKDLDIPFRLLLEAEGHVAIGHSTVHGPMELGKDIVSEKPSEDLFYFFQTKTGDAKPSDWADMERQIMQMVEVPYAHPNFSIGDPYKPVWVCTGQLSETVRTSLGLRNEAYRKSDRPTVEVWDRNTLIDKFHSAFFDMLFADESFVIDFLRLWSHLADYMSDEEDLREFFHRYLFDLPVAKERETRKHLATYALMLAQVSQRYVAKDDLYSAIDCALLGAVQLYEFIIAQGLEADVYQGCLDTVHEFIGLLSRDLVDQCKAREEALSDLLDPGSGPSEIFELPLRIHSLAAKLSLHMLTKSLNNEDFAVEAKLLSLVLENNPAFCHLLTERQMGTLWISIVGLLHSDHHDLAERFVRETFDWFMGTHAEGESGLPDPYQPYDVIISHHLGVEMPDAKHLEMRLQSYMLPILLKLICFLDLRDALAKHWTAVSHVVVREYLPPGARELFAYLPETGKLAMYGFAVTGSWSELVERYSERLPSEITDFVDRHPLSLLVLTLAYPWRAQWREVDRYT